jgi:porphobilinogen synthase
MAEPDKLEETDDELEGMDDLLDLDEMELDDAGCAPYRRPRRLRRTEAIRGLVRETRLSVESLIYPLFVVEDSGVRREIESLPGQYHWSPDTVGEEALAVADLGIPAVLLFGIPRNKDAEGSSASDPSGVIPEAIRAIKQAAADLLVVTDVCLCEYTSHGHCGIVSESGEILNDPTLEALAGVAVVHADAGADVIAPSDMMDGRVEAIRQALDDDGHEDIAIMSYSAKYASAFYGPFRDAAGSAPAFGDRRTHQMDIANRREALREVRLDIEEGADIVMVKPALAFLDVIREVRAITDLPLAAYNVSGEYAMVKAAAADWADERRLATEILTSIRRAGADIIITYHAKDAARWLRE